jgi:hypothetical protein
MVAYLCRLPYCLVSLYDAVVFLGFVGDDGIRRVYIVVEHLLRDTYTRERKEIKDGGANVDVKRTPCSVDTNGV